MKITKRVVYEAMFLICSLAFFIPPIIKLFGVEFSSEAELARISLIGFIVYFGIQLVRCDLEKK